MCFLVHACDCVFSEGEGQGLAYLPIPSWVSMGNKFAHMKSQIILRWNNITLKPKTNIKSGIMGALDSVCLSSGDVFDISIKFGFTPPGLNFRVSGG